MLYTLIYRFYQKGVWMKTTTETQNKMGVAPVLPLIIKMSLPAMFAMLVQSMYNIIDSIFVSRLGEKALTAVTLSFPVQILMIAIGVGTAIGLNSVVSRRLGERRHEDANRAATHAVYLGFLNFLVFALLGIFFVEPFVSIFTEDEYIFANTVSYLKIITVFSIGIFLQINFEKTLQATGNMIYPMIFQMSGALINIILDPIMIFGLFGFPKMGVAGAGTATVIGQTAALIFSTYVILTKEHEVHISLKSYRFDCKTAKEIYAVGIPSIIMQSIGALLITGLNSILISFSEAAVSVMGVYFRLQSFVFMPVFGLNQGLMPILGYNYGAKNKERMMQTLKYGIIIALGIMLSGTVVFFLFPAKLMGIFHATDEMLAIGVPALRIISLHFGLAAVGIVISALFQAVGIGKYSLYISAIRQMVVILPLAYLFSRLLPFRYIWYSFPIAEVVSIMFSFYFLKRLYDTKIRFLSIE